MATALGIVAGLALGVAAVLMVPGLVGVVVGVVVAALGYVGISSLATRERRLGGVTASLLPDGQLVSRTLDEAEALVGALEADARRTHDAEVREAILALVGEVRKLMGYVGDNPASNGQLAHVVNTYGAQLQGLVGNWVGLELSGSKRRIGSSRADLLVALEGATAAVEEALGEATDARAAQIQAASEAIGRLAAMDGIGPKAAPRLDDGPRPSGGNGTV